MVDMMSLGSALPAQSWIAGDVLAWYTIISFVYSTHRSKIIARQLKWNTIIKMVDTKRKTRSIVIKQIRAAILDGLYTPRERLMEADVAAKFRVSRSPVREALQALESEGTLVGTPYAGPMVRPLSAVDPKPGIALS
jgi:hypothetical protein